jgi:hypothetical protein
MEYEKSPSLPEKARRKKKKLRRSRTLAAFPKDHLSPPPTFGPSLTDGASRTNLEWFTNAVRVPSIKYSEISLGKKMTTRINSPAGDRIGKGQYGCVFKGKCRGECVAIKVLYNLDKNEETVESFRKEVEIMSHIHHPNVGGLHSLNFH